MLFLVEMFFMKMWSGTTTYLNEMSGEVLDTGIPWKYCKFGSTKEVNNAIKLVTIFLVSQCI